MDCEQSYFSVFMLVSMTGVALYNYSTILSIIINGTGKGIIRTSKRNATLETTEGVLSIPSVKLPSLDWEVHLFEKNCEIPDGLSSLDVVKSINTTPCLVKGRTLICEYIYPEQLGAETIRGYVSSIFDNECYVFTINKGEMIDYRKFANQFMLEIEDL